MTKEELKQHCEKQVKACEMWAENRGQEPSGKVYEEHKLILDLINELQDKSYELWKESYEVEHARNIQLEEKIKLLEQQPSEDCVSRQAEYNKGYNEGLEEFEKLYINEYDYKDFFKSYDNEDIQNWELYDLVAKYGVKKVIADFKKWQEEKKKVEEEIKVGDEVKDLATNNIGVVLSIGEKVLYITKFDYVYSNTRGSLEKTGRHFGEVEQLLDKMKGE